MIRFAKLPAFPLQSKTAGRLGSLRCWSPVAFLSLWATGCSLQYTYTPRPAYFDSAPVDKVLLSSPFSDKTDGKYTRNLNVPENPVGSLSTAFTNSLRDRNLFREVRYIDRECQPDEYAELVRRYGSFDIMLRGSVRNFKWHDYPYVSSFLPPFWLGALIGLPIEHGGHALSVAYGVELIDGRSGRVLWSGHFDDRLRVTRWGSIFTNPEKQLSESLTWHMDKAIDTVTEELRTDVVAGTFGFDVPAAAPVVQHPAKQKDLNAPIQADSPEQPAVTPMKNRWAVVVGVSHYADKGQGQLQDLRYAHTDAKAFRDSLVSQGWRTENIKCLLDEKATRAEVEKWVRYGPALKDALFVLFWAGHGYPDPVNPQVLFLACHDTDPANPGTGLRMSDVRHWLEERDARNVVVLADACHAGGLITGRGTDDSSARSLAVRIKRSEVPPGWIYLLGARTDDRAFEHPSLRGGLFTTCLVEGMRGAAEGYGLLGRTDGSVSLGELREYVRDKVKEKAFGLNLSGAFDIEDQTNTADRAVWELTFGAK